MTIANPLYRLQVTFAWVRTQDSKFAETLETSASANLLQMTDLRVLCMLSQLMLCTLSRPMLCTLQDFKPRVASAAQQPERWLGKASSMTSLAAKPKGRTAKGTKGKLTAAAKGTKGKKKGSKAADADTPRKKSDRVNWNAAGAGRRRSVERPSGRQFADAARLHHQVQTVNSSVWLHCVQACGACICLVPILVCIHPSEQPPMLVHH